MNNEQARNNRRPRRSGRTASWFLTLCTCVLLASCGQNMGSHSRLKPNEPIMFFSDGQSARPIVPGTVPHDLASDEPSGGGGYPSDNEDAPGAQWASEVYSTGKENGELVTTLPITVTREVLVRGQERYNIYCAPCHGATGNGDGLIPAFGLTPPPSYHTDQLRNAPSGHYFDVITNGFGTMYSYASRVRPADRWAITAYIRALQINQEAPLDVAPEQVQQFPGGG